MKTLTHKIADLIFENEGWKHRYTDAYDLANMKILELPELKAIQMQAEVKPDACDRWQKEKPNRPCLFVHRYNNKDKKPTLQYAVIDCNVLIVTDIELNEFTSTMEEFADGEFFIIDYI